jgi:hypothetical protein
MVCSYHAFKEILKDYFIKSVNKDCNAKDIELVTEEKPGSNSIP